MAIDSAAHSPFKARVVGDAAQVTLAGPSGVTSTRRATGVGSGLVTAQFAPDAVAIQVRIDSLGTADHIRIVFDAPSNAAATAWLQANPASIADAMEWVKLPKSDEWPNNYREFYFPDGVKRVDFMAFDAAGAPLAGANATIELEVTQWAS